MGGRQHPSRGCSAASVTAPVKTLTHPRRAECPKLTVQKAVAEPHGAPSCEERFGEGFGRVPWGAPAVRAPPRPLPPLAAAALLPRLCSLPPALLPALPPSPSRPSPRGARAAARARAARSGRRGGNRVGPPAAPARPATHTPAGRRRGPGPRAGEDPPPGPGGVPGRKPAESGPR